MAAEGPTSDMPVWETDIAAGSNAVMAVYRVGPSGSSEDVGYAIATQGRIGPLVLPPIPIGWRWDEEGLVEFDPNEVDGVGDPSVAYDSVTGDFVLASIAKGQGHPLVAHYDSSAGEFDIWSFIDLPDDPNGPPPGDKPWIVAGEVLDDGREQHQEFYICYTETAETAGGPQPLTPVCLRSADGGYNWCGGSVEVNDQPVADVMAQPGVRDDGPLYLAFKAEGDVIKFVRGEDPVTPGDPMTWDYLYDAQPPHDPLEVAYNATVVDLYLPITNSLVTGVLFPLLAVAPKDEPDAPDVLYLVYHDTVEPAGTPECPYDVDVFLHVLVEQPDATWVAGERVRVNDPDDPNAPNPSDQFHPAVTVTPGPTNPDQTRVHVIFYDDRRFEEQVDCPDPNDPNDPYLSPRFDVFYAYSDDGGQSFDQDDELLFLEDPDDPNDPAAVDYGLIGGQDALPLRDYIGIAHQADGEGYRIWTSYMGMYTEDPTEHKTVIWSSQIPRIWP